MPLVKFTVEDSQADQVKKLTRFTVASKAYEAAAHAAISLTVDLADARSEISRLRRIIDRQQQVLESARSAAALLVEAAGQGDLFMEKVPAVPSSTSRPAAAEVRNGTESSSSPRTGESMDHFLARLNRQSGTPS